MTVGEFVSASRALYRGAGKPAEVQADLEERGLRHAGSGPAPMVVLHCDDCQHEQPHRFFGRQAVLPGSRDGWALMYQCAGCGTVRRWGLVDK